MGGTNEFVTLVVRVPIGSLRYGDYGLRTTNYGWTSVVLGL